MRYIKLMIGLLVLTTSPLVAQSYTYNHDPMKQAQITVMESGTGSLTPEWYYNILHENYSKSAASKNKTLFRANAGSALYMQIDYAETVDSAMTKRAEIEALNMADRIGGVADIAWNVEGPKIEAKMSDFAGNINRILIAGGNLEERDYWQQYYNIYNSAIKTTQDAYMPNAQRKREYLRIYEDVSKKNTLLVNYLVKIHNRKKIQEYLAARAETDKADMANITTMSLARWKAAVGMTSGIMIEE